MKRLITLFIAAGFLACSAASFFLSLAAETAVNRTADYMERPSSAVDAVMRSRETAAATPDSNGLMIIGFLAVALLIAGAIIFMLRGGGEFLRQWRLTMRKQPAGPGRPFLPQAQYGQWTDVPQVPGARRVPSLPPVADFDEGSYQDYGG